MTVTSDVQCRSICFLPDTQAFIFIIIYLSTIHQRSFVFFRPRLDFDLDTPCLSPLASHHWTFLISPSGPNSHVRGGRRSNLEVSTAFRSFFTTARGEIVFISYVPGDTGRGG